MEKREEFGFSVLNFTSSKTNLYFDTLYMELNSVIGVETEDSSLYPFKDIGRPLLTNGHGDAKYPMLPTKGRIRLKTLRGNTYTGFEYKQN